MPVWKTIPVSEIPELRLSAWQVVELPDGDRHLVGWNETEREGRVSSRIAVFDACTRRATTQTGRVYELIGRPGHDADAQYTWNVWKRRNRVTEFKDVTEEVWRALQDAARIDP